MKKFNSNELVTSYFLNGYIVKISSKNGKSTTSCNSMPLTEFFNLKEIYTCISCVFENGTCRIEYKNNKNKKDYAEIPEKYFLASHKFFALLAPGNLFKIDEKGDIWLALGKE